MRLPQIPYPNYKHSRVKTKIQTLDFRGLNLSAGAGEGELSDSKGITTKDYPWMVQRPGRAPVEGYSYPSDVFEWDGHLVVVDSGYLYMDGEIIANVAEGKKQIAIVNTKMVIYPDKTVIDLTTGDVKPMAASVYNHGTAYLSTDTISFEAEHIYDRQSKRYRNDDWGDGDAREPYVWVYDSVSWDGTRWTLQGLQQASLFTSAPNGKYYIPSVSISQLDGSYVIASPSGVTFSVAPPDPAEYPPLPPGNEIGFYCQIFEDEQGVLNGQSRYADWRIISHSGAQENTFDLTDAFEVGDNVSVEGTYLGLGDVDHAIITDLTGNALTLNTTFLVPKWILPVESTAVIAGGASTIHPGPGVSWYDEDEETWFTVYLGTHEAYTIHEGNYLLYRTTDDGQEIIEWNPVRKAIVQTVALNAPAERHDGDFTAVVFNGEMEGQFTVSRDVPDLDFICAHENRLWGISNRVTNKVWNEETNSWHTFTSRVIYASELGQPTRMWTFSGVDTDSYQVAVGSEDDFTAICSFGGGVCCWKENRLHKILGNYPSEYYMMEYQYAGVTDAASMAAINETLFYKGRAGIYAWNGGVPSLISEKLGSDPYSNAVGGTDGARYYVSMRDTQDRFFVYDRGLWIKDDDIRVDAMCYYNGKMHFLIGGKIYTDGDETVEWMAEFATMTEGTLDRKGYTRILIRLDMYAGSSIMVETKQDRNGWETVWEQAADDSVTLNIPIRIGRCDRFQIRLSGVGRVTVQAMRREYIGGTER